VEIWAAYVLMGQLFLCFILVSLLRFECQQFHISSIRCATSLWSSGYSSSCILILTWDVFTYAPQTLASIGQGKPGTCLISWVFGGKIKVEKGRKSIKY
jgi:hypothetical protein